MYDPRGSVFAGCIDYISHTKHDGFIFENIVGLKTVDKGRAFEHVVAMLEALEGHGFTKCNTTCSTLLITECPTIGTEFTSWE